MRASDRAREHTAAQLRRRCSEGYLSLDTYEARVAEAFRATTAEQLARLLADLPASGLVARLRRTRLVALEPAAPALFRLPLGLVGETPLIVGRSRSCDVVLDHDTVSRRHAALARDAEGWTVTDLGSSNGTWLDGRRVGAGARVRPGDQLLLGGCAVLLR